MADVPSWIIDGWYSNNRGLQQLAIARYRMPVTDPGEVDRNRAFLAEPKPTTFGCSKCWRFAFSERTLCFWCRKS